MMTDDYACLRSNYSLIMLMTYLGHLREHFVLDIICINNLKDRSTNIYYVYEFISTQHC